MEDEEDRDEGSGSDSDAVADSSSSTSCSSSSVSSSDGVAPKAKAKPKSAAATNAAPKPQPKPVPSAPRQRNLQGRTPFGSCWLTPRERDEGVVGWQMLCTCPGHARCTKELSTSVAGSSLRAQVMLKVWAYMGMTLDDRDSHRDAWQDVLKYETFSPFPSMASLDASMPVSWPSRSASSAASSGSPGDLSTAGGGRPATPFRRTHPSLGACLPGTPVEVHLRMEELVARGILSPTTFEQRLRNRGGASGSSYSIPPAFEDALFHGYIHPNLPPPRDYFWVPRAGGMWILRKKGG